MATQAVASPRQQFDLILAADTWRARRRRAGMLAEQHRMAQPGTAKPRH
jgi:hypothetical protein